MKETGKGAAESVTISDWWGRVLLVVVVLTGLGVRIAFAPGAPIHTNAHGISDVRALVMPESGLYGGEELFGQLYPLIMRTLLGIIGETEDNLYLLNQVFGALCIAAVYGLARGLLFSQAASLLAALLLALHPAHVWLSASESCFVLFELLLLTGLTLVVLAFRRTSAALLWTSALLLTLAASLRALTAVAVPLGVVFALVAARQAPAGAARKLRDHLVAAGVGLGAVLALHCSGIEWVFAHTGAATAQLLEGLSGHRNILADATLTPPVLPVFALVGFVILLWRRRADALLLGASFALVYPTSLLVNACRTNGVRYQTPAHWVLYLAAGALFSGELLGRLSPKHRKPAIAAVVLSVVFCSGWGLFRFAEQNLEIAEHRFIKTTVLELPKHAAIRVPALDDSTGAIKPNFPDYLTDSPVAISDSPSGPGEVIYLGLACWWDMSHVSEAEAAKYTDGLRKKCRRACGSRKRIPIRETALPASLPEGGYHKRFHRLSLGGKKTVTIGFYRCGD